MPEISPISSTHQRDAWLSIIALLLLNILIAIVFLDAFISIFPSVSRVILAYCAFIFALLLPVICLSLRYGAISISDFRLRGLDFVVLFIAFILLVIVTSIISLKGPYKPYTFYGQEISNLPRLEYFIALLSIFLIFPFLEETLFRRYIFEIFRNKYKIPIAILLTALADTLVHITVGSVTGSVSIFFWQLFFTLIYFKSRLGVSITIHCLTNIFLYYI
jgi:membrane protease YdiL (CAAX protease family)